LAANARDCPEIRRPVATSAPCRRQHCYSDPIGSARWPGAAPGMVMRGDDESDPFRLLSAYAGVRLDLIARSFRRLVGQDLVSDRPDRASALWAAPRAIVAHGTEPEPVFFYGNQLALSLFETTAEDFIQMPSRRSAEPVHREDRARLLNEVMRRGFIDDYSGVRISGRRPPLPHRAGDRLEPHGRKRSDSRSGGHFRELDPAGLSSASGFWAEAKLSSCCYAGLRPADRAASIGRLAEVGGQNGGGGSNPSRTRQVDRQEPSAPECVSRQGIRPETWPACRSGGLTMLRRPIRP
jgi:hypothetical protein